MQKKGNTVQLIFVILPIFAINCFTSVVQRRVVQKAISANPGLKFNRLFILVC